MTGFFNSLLSRLLLALVLLLLLFALLSLWVGNRYFHTYFNEFNQRLNAPIAMYMALHSDLYSDGEFNQDKLSELAEQVMIINPGLDVFLLDSEGYVVAQTYPVETVERRRVALEPIKRFLNTLHSQADNNQSAVLIGSSRSSLPLFGDDPRRKSGRSVFSAFPISSNGRPVGYIYAVLTGPAHRNLFESMVSSYAVREKVFTTFSVLLFAFLGGTFLFSILTKRLRRLSERVNQWRSYYENIERNNNLDDRQTNLPLFITDLQNRPSSPAIAAGDEIGQLTSAYEQMMAHLLDQLFELKKSDKNRRELFASISHDLRTPLTSMQGYLETVHHCHQDLDANQTRRYISIALKQSGRLRQLVDNVLELSKFNSGVMKLHKQKFCALELVYDCQQDFKIQSEQSEINLRVLPIGTHVSTQVGTQVGTQAQSLAIYADLALVNRVLENLLQNAFRFTPKGGNIFIHVSNDHSGYISISVVDSGEGMSQESKAQAFQPYFTKKTTFSNRRVHKHSGLGLTIAKAITDHHGGSISIFSKAGKGTAVKVSFPAADSYSETPQTVSGLQETLVSNAQQQIVT